MKILGFEKSTVSKTVKNVTDAIIARAGQFIKWLVTPGARTAIKNGFYQQEKSRNVLLVFIKSNWQNVTLWNI